MLDAPAVHRDARDAARDPPADADAPGANTTSTSDAVTSMGPSIAPCTVSRVPGVAAASSAAACVVTVTSRVIVGAVGQWMPSSGGGVPSAYGGAAATVLCASASAGASAATASSVMPIRTMNRL